MNRTPSGRSAAAFDKGQRQVAPECRGRFAVRDGGWIPARGRLIDASPLSLAAEHLGTERMLRDSGLAWTILRNGWYTEHYSGAIAGALART